MVEEQVYGDHTLSFDEESHTYYLDGVMVPSVTAIIDLIDKPALRYWAADQTVNGFKKVLKPGRSYSQIQIDAMCKFAINERFRTSQEARDIGSLAHNWIEDYTKFVISNKTKPTIVTPEEVEDRDVPPDCFVLPHTVEARSSINAFLSWVEDHGVQFIDTEKRIVSLKDRWAGTRDTRAIIDDELGIWDYKTSKTIHGTYFIQLAPYAFGGVEMGEDMPDNLWVLRIPKDGSEFEAKSYKDLNCGFSMDELYETFMGLHKVWTFNDGKKRRFKKLK